MFSMHIYVKHVYMESDTKMQKSAPKGHELTKDAMLQPHSYSYPYSCYK